MKTKISKRGYILIKEHFTTEEIDNVKKSLTVKPFINEEFQESPEPFPVFMEIKTNYMYQNFGVLKNLVNRIM